MEGKNNEQIKLEAQDWQLINALVGILGVLAPAACLAFILGHSGIFLDFILSIDHAKPKGHPHHFHRWLTTLFLWPLRHGPHSLFTKPNLSKSPWKRLSDPKNPKHVWRNGSLLCTLVNTAVPGACRDPRQHWLQPPKHGMKLVMEYLDIQPIFTNDELNQEHLTPQQDRKFSKYLHEIHKLISKQIEIFNNMRFSTDYVARGMGLVIGEQNRKSIFYIYPIPKQNQQPCDLDIIIKGPSGNNGHIVIPSILHYQQKWQPPTEYRRAMYMSSKLNSISPTTQGTSFLRRLSLTPITRIHDPNLEIDIRVKISQTRAKITYIPQNTGIYEIKLVTRNCHVVGSPYSVPIELPSSTYQSHNNSSNESDEENEGKYIKRKKKIISRIVDFIDEKMLLQNDGTLVKIDDGKIQNSERGNQNKNNLECNIDIENKNKNNKLEIVIPKTRVLTRTSNGQIRDLKVNTFSKTSPPEAVKQETINNSQQIITDNENKVTPTVTKITSTSLKQIKENENSREPLEKLNKPNKNIIKGETSSIFTENEIKQKKEFPEINESIAEIKKPSFLSDFETNLIEVEKQTNAYCDKIPDESYINYDFKETLDKFNKNISKEENELLLTNNRFDREELLFNENNVDVTNDNSAKDFKIPTRHTALLTSSDDTKTNETINNTFKENLLKHNIPNKDSNPMASDKYSELSSSKELEENNNIIFNNFKSMENNTEPFILEEIINIDNFNFFTPDILESSNKNDEKSTPFIENINDEQISHTFTTKYSFVNPTFSSKVHDPTIYFPSTVSDYRKMFSKKDPSKELISSEYNFNNTFDKPYKVNNLIKVFDRPSKEYSLFCKQNKKASNESSCSAQKSNLQKGTIPTPSENGPDLVKCHIQKPDMSNTDIISSEIDYYLFQRENKSLVQKKLKSLGALSEDFDPHQCYLKSCLQQNFVQYIKEIKTKRIDQDQEMQKNVKIENSFTINHVKLGIVDKQKQFWIHKISNDDKIYFDKPARQKDSFNSKTKDKADKDSFTSKTKDEADKDSFTSKTKDDANEDSFELLCFKPFGGIVENNIKIFETKSSAINFKTNFVRAYDKFELQKSKSESFLRIPEENKIFQIQKSVSNEEIIKIPSIEERKNKFLQACQPSSSSADMKISEKKLEIRLDEKNEEPTSESIRHIQNPKIDNHDLIIPLNEISSPKIQNPTKKQKNLSFKRKVRFKRAKIFFHHLEGSDPKINNKELLENLSESNKILRSESDSCVSYHKPTTTPTTSIKISDRFQVDDLFQDILGDDKRFIGIPNKMAVVASLASLDSDSSRTEYDSGNEGEPDLDYFTGTPKKMKTRKKTIPGFHGEFPYLPNTNTWQYKSRKNTTSEELIPGRVLLTKNETDLNYK